MALSIEANWFALFQRGPSVAFVGVNYAPVIRWERGCIDGNDTIAGYVVEDRDGNDLPYPIAAQNVPGFVRYVKLTDDDQIRFFVGREG